MNLPNKLTLLRTILVPVFLIFALIDSIPFNYTIALAVFAGASITDALDGHIARKNNLVTSFGKFLDFENEEQFYEYVNNARKRALTLNDVDVRYGDQLLTLQTCNGMFDTADFHIISYNCSIRHKNSAYLKQ